MDQPFHFSLYLKRLGRKWKLILLPPILALLIAILFSLLMPVTYTATSIMVAPKPQLVWRWDNKVYDVVDLRFDWRSEVMPLVKTPKTAELALEQVGDQLSREYTPQDVLDATSVKAGAGSTFTIRVKASDPNDAALLANAMAQALPEVIADIYAGSIDAFAQAKAEVDQKYSEWDDRWRAFRAQYGIGLGFTGDITGVGEDQLFGNQAAIKQELTIKSSEVADLSVFLDKVTLALSGLKEGSGEASHMALLDSPMLTRYGLTFEELQALSPDALQAALEALQAQVQADLDAANADLLTLQDQVATIITERENIQRTRNVWYDSVKALENKMVELNVKRIVEGQRVHQVGEAQPPAHPSQPNWPLNLTLAVVAGLLGGFFLAVLAVYFEGDDPGRD